MKVTIAQRKGNGDMVTTLIEPVISDHPGLPKLHSVRIERHENGSNHRTTVRFFLDSEQDVELFLTYIYGPFHGQTLDWADHIAKLYDANNLEELYA